MAEYIGFIRNTSKRDVQIKNGRNAGKTMSAYSAEIHTDAGVTKIDFGFDRPSVQEGDYVYLIAREDRGYNKVDQSSVQRREPPQAQPQQAEAVTVATASFQTEAPQEFNRKTNPEDAKRMTWANARDAAIRMVDVLMKHKALPTSVAEGKAGMTKRFDEMQAMVGKLTVQFYHDSLTLRQLEVIADTPPTQGELHDKDKMPEQTAASAGGSALDD